MAANATTRLGIRLSIMLAFAGLLAAASGPRTPAAPVTDWPLANVFEDQAPSLPAWPYDRIDPAPAAFAAAAEPQPVMLPLRRCGIADCLRPAPGAYDTPAPEPEVSLRQLFRTPLLSRPIDQRHVLVALVMAALTALLWRTRTRRARMTY